MMGYKPRALSIGFMVLLSWLEYPPQLRRIRASLRSRLERIRVRVDIPVKKL